jgi:Ca2+:H+ antiporter
VKPLLREIRHDPMLRLLAFVPAVFVAATLAPEAHTGLFVPSVLAIVPLASLLSHATESVAAKTGNAAGGLLSATLGNLTELVIVRRGSASDEANLLVIHPKGWKRPAPQLIDRDQTLSNGVRP